MVIKNNSEYLQAIEDLDLVTKSWTICAMAGGYSAYLDTRRRELEAAILEYESSLPLIAACDNIFEFVSAN